MVLCPTDDPKRLELQGQYALEYDVKLKADPVIGVNVEWDFIEMVCRRHPLAFLIKKALDLALYLKDPKNTIDITFSIKGELELAGQFKHNTLSGNSYSKGYAAKREDLIYGDQKIILELKGSFEFRDQKYFIIGSTDLGGKLELGAKAEMGIKTTFAADIDGLFIANNLHFDGITFYVQVEGSFKVTFLGVVIINWKREYKPKPYTFGKGDIDTSKLYLNNPNKV